MITKRTDGMPAPITINERRPISKSFLYSADISDELDPFLVAMEKFNLGKTWFLDEFDLLTNIKISKTSFVNVVIDQIEDLICVFSRYVYASINYENQVRNFQKNCLERNVSIAESLIVDCNEGNQIRQEYQNKLINASLEKIEKSSFIQNIEYAWDTISRHGAIRDGIIMSVGINMDPAEIKNVPDYRNTLLREKIMQNSDIANDLLPILNSVTIKI